MTRRVEAGDQGKRLDVYLCEHTDCTRSRVASLIREGAVSIDGHGETKPGFALKCGMSVSFTMPEVRESSVSAQEIPIRILYQDSDLAVVYKPSGMVVHPAAGSPDHTLDNALLYSLTDLSGIGGVERPGIVHRIDKDTSGLLLVAKNDRAHVFLSEQIKAHTVKRAYLAIAQGAFREESGRIDRPIGRHPTDRKRQAIVENGREAVTDWRVLEHLRGACLLECRLHTGRTHQIRVHMASIGHPLLGDAIYGPKKMPYPVEGGQLLHAYQLGFVHPTTGEEMLFEAEPEARFTQWRKKLSL